MGRKKKFESIFANCSCGRDCSFDINPLPDEYDCHDTCIVWNKIEFFGVASSISEEKLEAIYLGDYTNATKVGIISGCLILCKQIIAEGEDPHEICDDVNEALEYTLSALTDVGEPLDLDPEQNVYYIHEFNIEHDCNDMQLKSSILENLSGVVLKLLHVAPDIIAFYPTPLEYECDAGEEERYQTLQSIAVQKMDAVCANKEKIETNIIQFGELYQFSEDEMNMIMRRRYSGSSYPQKAKNMQEFDFYEMNGFQEAGNSRLLYKLINADLD
ncbi:hypothetical protein [Oscillibacter sp.]|uniref:hypothetical protein n=1 Tax=Oscillibacter sp. TaxID=1945593 RepID=UPI00289A573D|nr:hypothetical protein [Oscillibacter sp.]